jgi:hypothetical protein
MVQAYSNIDLPNVHAFALKTGLHDFGKFLWTQTDRPASPVQWSGWFGRAGWAVLATRRKARLVRGRQFCGPFSNTSTPFVLAIVARLWLSLLKPILQVGVFYTMEQVQGRKKRFFRHS